MATIVDTEKEAVTPDTLPGAERAWVLKPRHLVACVFLGTVILYINTLPLLDSTIWLDVFQGQWIIDHGVLPKSDPAQPLTDGMHIVHTNWLAQVAYGLADRWGGPRAVSNLFAALMLAYLLVLQGFHKQTSASLTIAGPAVTLLVGATFDLMRRRSIWGASSHLVWLLTHGSANAAETADEGSQSVWLAGLAIGCRAAGNLANLPVKSPCSPSMRSRGCDAADPELRATPRRTFRSRVLLAGGPVCHIPQSTADALAEPELPGRRAADGAAPLVVA